MTTMPKTSGMSDTLRSGTGIALPDSGGRALANAAQAWFAAATECQRETIGFVSMRLEKNGKAVREMMGGKNLADAAAIQSRWVEETLRDYSDEMTKLMTICTKSLNGGGRNGG